jgi:hypothetical protein
MSQKEVILLLSDNSSNNPGNDANKMDVTVDFPANGPIETDANMPVANDPLTFWSNVRDNFVVKNNITLLFTIRGPLVALRQPSARRGYGASMVDLAGRGFGCPMYNPSQPKVAKFWSVLVGLLTPASMPLPSCSLCTALGAWLIFYLCQGFISLNSRRDHGLMDNAPKMYIVGMVDLDNLIKFTLDAIGGVAFVDNGQFVN